MRIELTHPTEVANGLLRYGTAPTECPDWSPPAAAVRLLGQRKLSVQDTAGEGSPLRLGEDQDWPGWGLGMTHGHRAVEKSHFNAILMHAE